MLLFLYNASTTFDTPIDSGRMTPPDQIFRSDIRSSEATQLWEMISSDINYQKRWVGFSRQTPVLKIPITPPLEANALIIYKLLRGGYVTLPSHIESNFYDSNNLNWLNTAYVKTTSEGKYIIGNEFFIIISEGIPSFVPSKILETPCTPSIFSRENSDEWSMPSSVGPSTNASAQSTPEKQRGIRRML